MALDKRFNKTCSTRADRSTDEQKAWRPSYIIMPHRKSSSRIVPHRPLGKYPSTQLPTRYSLTDRTRSSTNSKISLISFNNKSQFLFIIEKYSLCSLALVVSVTRWAKPTIAFRGGPYLMAHISDKRRFSILSASCTFISANWS